MRLTVRRVCGKYNEVTVADTGLQVNLGTYDKIESEMLAQELMEAIVSLRPNNYSDDEWCRKIAQKCGVNITGETK